MSQTLRPYQADSLAREIWNPVPGYEGCYEVSSWGRVKSVERKVLRVNKFGTVHEKLIRERILRQHSSKAKYAYGRLTVSLSKNSEAKTVVVAHAVAAAFLGPRPDGHEVAHCDGNPKNNHIENLRYATPKDNSADKYLHGTVLFGEDSATSKLRTEEIIRIRELRGAKTVYEIAEDFGISIAHVSRIQTGKRWGHIQ